LSQRCRDYSAQGGQEWATGEDRMEGLQEGVPPLAQRRYIAPDAAIRVRASVSAEAARADLTDAHLTNANLSHAYMVFAKLQSADLRGATLKDAWLFAAYLDDGTKIAQQQLDQVLSCLMTGKLPTGLTCKPPRSRMGSIISKW